MVSLILRIPSVISANYGLGHVNRIPANGNLTNPPVYFKFTKDTFYSGETATAYLYAGDKNHPLVSAYGIGYQAMADGGPVIFRSQVLTAVCDYFCSGTDLNYMHHSPFANSIDATMVETSGKSSINSSGKLALLTMNLADSHKFKYSKKGDKIYARLLGAFVVDSTGKKIPVYDLSDSAIVIAQASGIAGNTVAEFNIHIYPNPANNELTIETGDQNAEQIGLYNNVGQLVLRFKNCQSPKNILDVSGFPSGIYFIQIKTDQGMLCQKVMISRQ